MVELDKVGSVFILGIKGVGMAQIAIILHKMGKQVMGVDVSEVFITDEELAKYPIAVKTSFDPSSLPDKIDLAIYSAAHGGMSNPLMQELQKRGTGILSQADFLGMFMQRFHTSIAVAGSHGKTTTSSLLSHALLELKAEPSYLTGSSQFGKYPAGDYRGEQYFVVEADEYGVNPPEDKTPKFLKYHPTFTLCTNVDFDHPDVFENLEEVEDAYQKLLRQSEYCIVCADSDTAVEIAKNAGVQFETYGFGEGATYRIINHESGSGGASFDLLYGDSVIEHIRLALYGDHNVLNAAGVVTLLLKLGFMAEQIKQAVSGFAGAKRRFEVVYDQHGLTIVDDYAHHPAEIKSIIQAVIARYGIAPTVVFQPHTFSRTQALMEEFSSAFAQAGATYILPIFASAREDAAKFSVTNNDLANRAQERGFASVTACTKEELASNLSKSALPQLVLTLGAGDVYKLHSDIIRVYAPKSG